MPNKKSTKFNSRGIKKLANNKPAVYTIKGSGGDPLYIGIAKKGRVKPRIKEHLPGSIHPVSGGKTVAIQPKPSIRHARKSEADLIKKLQPPVNKQGKSLGKGPGMRKKSRPKIS